MRNPFRPVFAPWRIYRRCHQPAVFPLVVGADKPQPIAVVDGILLIVYALGNRLELARRLVGCYKAALGSDVAACLKHNVFAVARAPHAQVEALIVFLVNQRGFRQLLPIRAEQLVLPLLLLVFHGIEQRAVIRGPHHRSHPLHFALQRLACLQIFYSQRVLPEAGQVSRIRQPAPVVADVGVADRKKCMPLAEHISVQQYLFRRVCVRPGFAAAFAAVDSVLQPLFSARIVPPHPVAVGNRYVGLLNVAQHLLVELFAQPGQRGHHCLGVGILGLKIRRHIGIFFVAQPGVIVVEAHSKHFFFGGNRRGNGQCGEFGHCLSVYRAWAPYVQSLKSTQDSLGPSITDEAPSSRRDESKIAQDAVRRGGRSPGKRAGMTTPPRRAGSNGSTSVELFGLARPITSIQTDEQIPSMIGDEDLRWSK